MRKKVHSLNVLKECNVSTSKTLRYLICTVKNCPQRWLWLFSKKEYWNHSVKKNNRDFCTMGFNWHQWLPNTDIPSLTKQSGRLLPALPAFPKGGGASNRHNCVNKLLTFQRNIGSQTSVSELIFWYQACCCLVTLALDIGCMLGMLTFPFTASCDTPGDGQIQGVFFNWAYPLDWAPPKMPRLAPP